MAKALHSIQLTGVTPVGKAARLGSEVHRFVNMEDTISAKLMDGQVNIVTHKGNYMLRKHPAANYYYGTLNGVKVQITVRKIVAELRYWA